MLGSAPGLYCRREWSLAPALGQLGHCRPHLGKPRPYSPQGLVLAPLKGDSNPGECDRGVWTPSREQLKRRPEAWSGREGTENPGPRPPAAGPELCAGSPGAYVVGAGTKKRKSEVNRERAVQAAGCPSITGQAWGQKIQVLSETLSRRLAVPFQPGAWAHTTPTPTLPGPVGEGWGPAQATSTVPRFLERGFRERCIPLQM